MNIEFGPYYLQELDINEKMLYDFFKVLSIRLTELKKTHDILGYASDIKDEQVKTFAIAYCFHLDRTLVFRAKST